MRAWFMSRAPRERLVLAVGGVLVAIILFWNLIWAPLNGGVTTLRQEMAQHRAVLVDLHRAASTPRDARAQVRHAPASMVVLVDTTSRTHGLAGAFNQTQPDGSNGITVSFRGAQFDLLVRWLEALESGYGVRVEAASVNKTATAGLVDGQLSLRRP